VLTIDVNEAHNFPLRDSMITLSDSNSGGNKRPVPDPSLAGRVFLILRAALRQPVVSSDDALLSDELDGRRKGDSKMVGRAVAFAHQAGWLQPLYDEDGRRLSVKSARKTRASGIIELWCGTPTTHEGLKWASRHLVRKPPARDLFDNHD
jgi:hypothetical protein